MFEVFVVESSDLHYQNGSRVYRITPEIAWVSRGLPDPNNFRGLIGLNSREFSG